MSLAEFLRSQTQREGRIEASDEQHIERYTSEGLSGSSTSCAMRCQSRGIATLSAASPRGGPSCEDWAVAVKFVKADDTAALNKYESRIGALRIVQYLLQNPPDYGRILAFGRQSSRNAAMLVQRCANGFPLLFTSTYILDSVCLAWVMHSCILLYIYYR